MRHVAEAGCKSDHADRAPSPTRIDQRLMRTVEPPLDHGCGEGSALGREQRMDVAWRDAQMGRDASDR